jgi:hypothetical protein
VRVSGVKGVSAWPLLCRWFAVEAGVAKFIERQ